MNAEQFKDFLGKTDDSAEIRKLLAKLGAKPPRLKRGDLEARVRLTKQGLVLVFEPAGKKTSVLKLESVQFYPARGDFSAFAGELPAKLEFADSRASTRKKLGKPAFSNDEMDLDKWDFDEFSVAVEYYDGRKTIGVVHLLAPYEGGGDDDDEEDDDDEDDDDDGD